MSSNTVLYLSSHRIWKIPIKHILIFLSPLFKGNLYSVLLWKNIIFFPFYLKLLLKKNTVVSVFCIFTLFLWILFFLCSLLLWKYKTKWSLNLEYNISKFHCVKYQFFKKLMVVQSYFSSAMHYLQMKMSE